MVKISLNAAINRLMGVPIRSPEEETAQYERAQDHLRALFDVCRRDWPSTGRLISSGVLRISAVLHPWPPSLVLEVLAPIESDWPNSVAALRDAAEQCLPLEQYNRNYRTELQQLIDDSRRGELNFYARRRPVTRQGLLTLADLSGPYEIDGTHRHLVPDLHVRASRRPQAGEAWSDATFYDVQVSAAQVAQIMGETDDLEPQLREQVQDWYSDVHVPNWVKVNNIPKREQTFDEAVAKFGKFEGLDTMLRACRAGDLTPKSWHKPGRRRGRKAT